MNGLHWDFLSAQYDEAKFFGRIYGGEQYWRRLKINPEWSVMYLMGGEL